MVSPFYDRTRRLAYLFAVLSVLLLGTAFAFSLFIAVYGNPRAAAGGDAVYVIHTATRPGEHVPGTRLMVLDPDLGLRERHELPYEAGAIVADDRDLVAYFGNRYAALRGGELGPGADLGQGWDVRDAAHDAGLGQTWIFGWSHGAIVARKRYLGKYSEEIRVAPCGLIERLSASMDGKRGPLVAWKEKASTQVRAVLFDPARQEFVPRAEFEIGTAEHWDAVIHGGRVLLLHYRRDDRTFRRLGLRVECCRDCGLPPPPPAIFFDDPPMTLGRKVTGVAAAVAGDRLLVVLTRWTTAQFASVPLEGLAPEPGSTLRSLGAEPAWRHLVASLWPILMLFFSFSLVFLGFCLLRERGRFALEQIRPVSRGGGPEPAEILQRAMAFILDLIALLPFYIVAVEVLNVSPEGHADLADPRFRAMMALWFGMRFLYHFVFEWAAGRTPGKRLIGIRVTNADGSRLSFRGALVRNLVRIADADVPFSLFLGTSIMMVMPRRQRLGDIAGRTVVIQEDRKTPR